MRSLPQIEPESHDTASFSGRSMRMIKPVLRIGERIVSLPEPPDGGLVIDKVASENEGYVEGVMPVCIIHMRFRVNAGRELEVCTREVLLQIPHSVPRPCYFEIVYDQARAMGRTEYVIAPIIVYLKSDSKKTKKFLAQLAQKTIHWVLQMPAAAADGHPVLAQP